MSAITAKASRKMKKYAVLTREPRCFLGSFDFSWEQRKFEEIAVRSSVICSDDTLPRVEYEDIVSGTGRLNKDIYAKQSSKSGIVFHQGDVLYGKLRPYLQNWLLPTFDGLAVGDFWVLQPQNADSSFLYRLIQSRQFDEVANQSTGTKMPRADWKLVSKTVFSIPSNISEQAAIGTYFTALDSLITLHQRKCALLFSSFQAFISMMFTTSTFSWEQRKFDEVFDCTVPNNTLSRAELSYDEGTVLNVHYGDVLIKYGSVLDVQKDDIPRIPHRCREDFNGALLQDGDVIIADTAEDETTGKACEIGNLQGSAIVSGLHTMVCRPRNRMALGYLGYYLNSNAYHHQLLPLMQGIKVLSLSRSNIQKTSVSYPIAVKEQQLIAYYFSQLDNLITLHQRKCIFFTGRAGRLISTVNKKRITSSWEQRKLASLCEKFTDGDWIESKDQSDFGVRLVQTGNVGVAEYLDKTNNKKWISEDTFDRLHCEEVLPGDILISRLPEPAGRACIVPLLGTKMITAVDCTIVRTAPDMSNKFLVQYLSSQAYFDDVNTCLAGGTRQRISRGNLANFNVPIPVKKSEQDAIGMFFGYLDNLITLHQRKPFLMKWRTSDANRNQTNRLVL